MRIEEYQKLAMRTCSIPEEKSFDRLVHGVTGLVSEFDEFLNASGSEHNLKEAGDCCWMLAEICESQGVDISLILMFSRPMTADIYSARSGIAGLAECIQKSYQGHEIDRNVVVKNCAMVMAYIEGCVKEYRSTIEKVMEMNIKKLKARYPEGFEAKKSLHRAEGDI